MKKSIIFIHGWGGSRESLKPLALEVDKLLGNRYAMHILELPGHGNTNAMQYSWTMNDYRKWVDSYIEINNLEEITFVGHSFGGKILLEHMIESSHTTYKYVLINASGIKPRNNLKKNIFRTTSIAFKPLSKFVLKGKLKYLFYKFIVRETDYIKTSQEVKETFNNIINEHYDHKLKLTNRNALLIWGDKDTYTPLWMGNKMNKLLKNSKMEILDGTHGLPLHNPNKVAKLIVKFIENE